MGTRIIVEVFVSCDYPRKRATVPPQLAKVPIFYEWHAEGTAPLQPPKIRGITRPTTITGISRTCGITRKSPPKEAPDE